MKELLIVIGSLLTIFIGIWKWISGKSRRKTKILEEAQKDLDNAHKNKNPSDILDAWDKSNRL